MSETESYVARAAGGRDDFVYLAAFQQLLLERSHDLITVLDTSGSVTYASPSWRRLGWDPEQVGGTPMLELVHPDDAGAAASAISHAAAGEPLESITVRLRRADGSWTVVDSTSTSIAAEDGQVAYVVSTARDVTEREELRERVAEVNALYRVADSIAHAAGLDELLEEAVDAMLAATGAARAAVLLYDDAAVMRFRAWRGLSDAYRAAVEGHSPWTPDTADPRPVLVADVGSAGLGEELERAVRDEGIAALAFVPLVHGARLLGKFMLYHDEPHAWSGREVRLARMIANHLASATVRTRAQEALRASSEQLATIMRTVEEGIVVQSASGELVYANEAAARIIGFDTALDLLAEDRAGVLARFDVLDEEGCPLSPEGLPGRRALKGEASERVIRYRVRDTGEERWSLVRANPVYGPDGSVELSVSVVHDITAARTAERRLRFLGRASELLNETLHLERTLGAIAELAVPSFAGHITVDLLEDGEIRCVAARHVDPAKTALMIALRQEYPPTVPQHPVQAALRTGEAQFVPDVQAQAESMAHDERHAAAIHELQNTSGIVVPLIARGRTLGAMTFGSVPPQPSFTEADVEIAQELGRRTSAALDNALLFEQVQERAHAAEALEFVDDGVILVDSDEIVRLWNPAAEKTFRVKAARAIGRPIGELIAEWNSLRERIRVAPEPSAGARRAETLPIGVEGEERWLSFSAVGFPGGTVYAFRDLTEERAVDQLKSDFVSTVSHELRTPLAAIYGAALTLRRDDVRLEESQRAGLLDVIAGEADRLARIVNDILWASRLDSGQMSVAIERCDAPRLLKQVVDALRTHTPGNLTLDVDAPEGLPPVAADADKLRQVLMNVLDNAVKYSPDGGRVRVGVTSADSLIQFRVEDEGLGIPVTEQSRIFEKFFRLDPNLTRGVGGTGLGLYICRELVYRMHGRIWVESDGRRGSTFFVELPVAI